MPPIPSALVAARRAMVIAAASMVIAALAVAVALLGDPESDPAESAALEQAGTDAAAARTEAEAAAAIAEAAAAIADAAAIKAAAAQEALAAALAEAGGAVDPEVIASLEAQLEEARTLAATALVAANASPSVEDVPAADTTSEEEAAAEDAPEPEEAAAVEDAPEPEEAAAVEDAPEPEEAAAVEDAPVPEDTDTAAVLPGESYEFGPPAGAGLAVVGVAHDSALNVRDVPNGEIIARLDNVMDGVRDPVLIVRDAGSDDIIATLDLRRGVVATGNIRKLPTTIWYEVRIGDLVGWASGTYLAPLGADRDATAEVVEALGGTSTADTLSDIGLLVSGVFASSGEVQSRTTISSRPGVFEAVGDVTLDVLGLPDDAVRGYRINITADAGAEDWTQEDAGPFTLRSVTVTPICYSHRGVSQEGLCL